MNSPEPTTRAAQIIEWLSLAPHPEGGHYREHFRSGRVVLPSDGRAARAGLTSIDFLLCQGEFSAWHRVASDEAWHLLEGGPLRLWLLPPGLGRVDCVDLAPVDAAGARPAHVVPAGWWQAAEPLGDHALCGATVGPGFDFSDFSFLRADPGAASALATLRPDLQRLR